MLFTKVGAVIVLVSDMERSVKFYKDVLGLPIKTESPDWTEFFHKDTTIAFASMKKKSRCPEKRNRKECISWVYG